MANKFKSIDIYGVKPEFLFKGKDKYKTVCGAFATLLTFCIVAVFGTLFGADFYLRTNPIIISQEVIGDKSPIIYPTSKTFPLYYAQVTQSFTYAGMEEAGLNIYYLYFYIKRDNQGQIEKQFMTSSKPKKCRETSAIENPAMTEPDAFCLDWEDLSAQYGEPVPFGGTIDESEFAMIALYMTNYTLDYKTYRPTRFTPHSKIAEYFGNKQASFITFYPSYYLDVESIDEPIKTEFESKPFNFNPSLSLTERRIFEQSLLDDDIGWIFKDVKHYEVIKENKFEMEIFLNSDLNETDRTVYYQQPSYLGRKNTIIRRRFMKIQELTAIIGGFLKVILIGFQALVGVIAGFKMNLEYFTFLEIRTKTKTNNFIKDNSANLSKNPIVKPRKRESRLTFLQYLVSFTGIKKYSAKETYNANLKMLEEKLDVVNILKLYDTIKAEENDEKDSAKDI